MKLFVEGTSILKKLSFFYFIILIVGSIIGVFSKVIIVDPWVTILTYISIFLSMVIFYFLFKNIDWVYSAYPKKIIVKSKWKIIVSLILFIPLMIMMVVAKGLPSFLHFLAPKDNIEIVLTVEAVSSSYYSKGCKGKIYVKEFRENMLFNRWCVRNKTLWSSLKAGDNIKVYGSLSVFGFKYKRFEKFAADVDARKAL